METVEAREFNGHMLAMVFHDAGEKKLVVFCHGFRGTAVGPNRFFVRAARKLAEQGISSLRFDQYGSGNSEGEFIDSSFNDWVATVREVVKEYADKKYKIALFGQSMGGAAVIVAAADMPGLRAVVAWVPDPNVEPFHHAEDEVMEEGGQLVKAKYWKEAHEARVGDKFSAIKAPTYVVQCTADEYVDQQNRDVFYAKARPYQKIDTFDGYSHSSWSYEQSEDIINKSVAFVVEAFSRS
jgi:esterase/lipase